MISSAQLSVYPLLQERLGPAIDRARGAPGSRIGTPGWSDEHHRHWGKPSHLRGPWRRFRQSG